MDDASGFVWGFLIAHLHLGPDGRCRRQGEAGVACASQLPGMKKGMIYSPAHGDMAFTVPLFDEFMKRAIPKFQPPATGH